MVLRPARESGGDHGVVTFLFTDMVRSTELLSRLGDEEAEAFRRDHFRLLRDALEAFGGEEVKNLGDGLMTVFVSPVDAVSCAVAMQQAAERYGRRHGLPFELRIGLELGEPSREGDDYFGTAVVVASRLCNAAGAGQIVISHLVRGVVGTRRGFEFRSLGMMDLKGLDEPVPAWEVQWEPVGEDPLPLPHPVAGSRDSVFVGRRTELERLREIWDEVRKAERRTVMLSGEPGIGKTGLSIQLAMAVHEGGGTVLYGRCDEEVLVSFQPFVEALSHYVCTCPVDELREQLRTGAAQLARLVPGLLDRLPELRGTPVQPDDDRYWLFETVEALLREASQRRPLLLVLDDLHWADKPTLLLLQHLVRAREPAALMICGTYRHTDLRRTQPLTEMLADLRREPAVDRIALGGLDEADVRELVAAITGQELHPENQAVAQVLVQETEGNPLFVRETMRHLVATGRLRNQDGVLVIEGDTRQLGISEGLREVIGRRLTLLSPPCNRLLGDASVLGRDFAFDVLCDMTRVDEDEILAAVEEAVAAELLAEVPAGRAATYAFTHAVVRQTLYEELSLARRQRMHLRAAEALERRAGEQPSPSVVASLAAHYQSAGTAANADKVIRYSLLAAEHARSLYAWEDAVTHCNTALELMEEDDSEPALRAQLLERLGDLMYMTGIDYAKGAAYLERALVLYEKLGDAERAAQVHSRLGRNLSTLPDAMDLPRAFEHFEAAKDVMEAGPERAALGYLYSGIAAAYIGSGDVKAGLDASTVAVEASRRLGNDALCTNASLQRGWHLFMSGQVGEGLAIIEEAYQTACKLELGWMTFQAAGFRCILACCLRDPRDGLRYIEDELAKPQWSRAPIQRKVLLELFCQARLALGDIEGARRRVHEASGGYFSLEAIVATAEGDTARAEHCWRERLQRDRRSGARWWQIYDAASLAQLLTWRGASGEAESVLAQALSLAEEGGAVAAELLWIRPALAMVCADLGRLPEADQHLARAVAIQAGGEDWRGAAGRVELAAALVASGKGAPAEAEARLEKALSIARHFSLVWDEAEVLHRWGDVLSQGGHREAANEKYAAAAEVYRSHGAGEWWWNRS